jgi:large subunit ribosomal protein L17
MRHQKAGRKFGRNPSHRRAMFRNLAANLIMHERIETTDAKAKELKRIADRLLTRALRLGPNLTGDLSQLKEEERAIAVGRRVHAERLVARFLPKRCVRTLPGGETEEVDIVRKLFQDLAPRYLSRVQAGRGGGYTRIIKKSWRRGDGASMAYIEFVAGE